MARGGKRLYLVGKVVLSLLRRTNLSAPLVKGVEVSGGHFGQIQGATAHIDSSGCRRRLGGGDVGGRSIAAYKK